ncbi:MAG: hypothetical protein AAF591_17095 [Verrucomicrobiota bacterium]
MKRDARSSTNRGLRQLRWLKGLYLVLLVAFLPVSLLLGAFVSEQLGAFTGFASIGALFVIGLLEQTNPCPRCGNSFHVREAKGGVRALVQSHYPMFKLRILAFFQRADRFIGRGGK